LYAIKYERRAERELLSLSRETARRIARAIDNLDQDARPRGCRKITGGGDTYRIRVGRYRVVYEISEAEHLVVILRVALRTERTYRGL